MRLLIPFLLTACGESWTWDADGKLGDTGGAIDSGALHDLDGDGFTGIAAGGDDCWDDPNSIPAGFGAISGTAQPTAAEVHPDATETWYDGVDQDCAGDDDFDQDLDTHRSATHADGAGAIGDDCYDAVDDAYPSGAASCAREGELAPSDVNPGATDAAYDGTDADCSGNDDFDQDNDGFGRCAECDDTNASIYPNDAADPWYDGVDANCDGNDGDRDGDGYYVDGYEFAVPPDFESGDCADDPTQAVAALNGFPDLDAAGIHPAEEEAWYDGIDQDCSGDSDFDQDGDGQATDAYADSAGGTGPDCVDTDAGIYVGSVDAWYDGVDSDCAGNDDYDRDGDGYASGSYSGADCDDTKPGVSPSATEDCGTADDDDCDGDGNDENATGCSGFSPDRDADGYGDLDGALCLCVAEGDFTMAAVAAEDSDCDDGDDTVNPAATEVCNDGVDNDCDGGAGACALSGGSLSGADAEYTGETAFDRAGASLSGTGDFNGDGFEDFVIGAPGNTDGGAYAGAAYLVVGSATPVGDSLSAAVQYSGEEFTGSPAIAVGGAGDVNGDGFTDFLVGSPGNTEAGTGAGAAYLVLGTATPGSANLDTAIRYTGETDYDSAGQSVSAAGDVNGDGFGDMLVGAYASAAGGLAYAGAAYLLLGSSSPGSDSLTSAFEYSGYTENSRAGWSVAAAGDVDGDGFDDMLFGAIMDSDAALYAGAAYLVVGDAGPASGSLAAAVKYAGERESDYAGYSVSRAGDVNADGYADVLVGAPNSDDPAPVAGSTYLILGTTTPMSGSLSAAILYTGVAGGDYAGIAVSGGGDVDADGFDDFVVGAFGGGVDVAGAAYVVVGSPTPASDTLASAIAFAGTDSSDSAGSAVSMAGDVNLDGVGDLLIGAYVNSDAGSAAGAAYLILGTGL